MENKNTLKLTVACIAFAAMARLLPHPPNMTPLTAMALLGGAYLTRKQALLVPLAALLASDLILGLHSTIPFVYASFLLIALMGRMLRHSQGATRMMGTCVSSSLLFFIMTNLGVWLTQSLYSHDFQGLVACYTAALPFLRQSLLGDLAFTALLFGLQRVSLKVLASPATA